MARVDSILRLATEQGADELHLGTGAAPRMFAAGTPKKLSIPETSEVTLRHLLGEILEGETEKTLRSAGKIASRYEAKGVAAFDVDIRLRGGEAGFDVIFRRQGAKPAAPEPAARAPSPVPPPPATQLPAGGLVELLRAGSKLGASDVHLAAGERAFVRVAGALRPLGEGALDVEAMAEPVLDAAAREALAAGKSADFALEVPGLGRFRGNAFRTRGRLALALRLLRPTPPNLDDLGLPAELGDLPLRAHGLVIVCGPTGSGKSTTLAAIARRALEERSALLVSLEDPIEYSLEASPKPLRGVARQRQIGSDVRDFPTGLRDALREDPDLILVGEMRDPESITLALTAAETGHLVLTSLHARSAASAIERIADAYAPERQKQVRVQLADALAAVIVQRLLPARRGGRVVAMEVLRATASVENLIREGRTAQLATAMQAGRDDGMLPFEKSLAALVKSGDVSLEDALAAANDRDVLLGYVR